MRIIGGRFKGRRFNPPAKNWPTRPTTDFAKEGLFNILTNQMDFENIAVLDLFGGTGNISYECASRGCTDITYVEKFAPCTLFVKEIAETLDIASDIRIIKSDVFKFLASNTRIFDLIFADPPYSMPTLDELPGVIFSSGVLADSGTFVLEHGSQYTFKNHPGFKEDRKYGDSVFSFFD